MLRELGGAVRVYIAAGVTDMRKGLDGLAAIVRAEFDLDPFDESAFVFCGRRRDRIKVLLWTREGFELGYKRLENGVFQWPRDRREAMEVTPEQYRRLMDGLTVIERGTIHDAGRPSLY